jgi:FkbM family methyltransferase
MHRRVFKKNYENDFDQQMIEQISQTDIVWDIGANVGFFTTKFAEKVGSNGHVFAFEPAVSSYTSLVRNCVSYANITCLNLALSNKSGSLSFRDSGIENDPTNGLVENGAPSSLKVDVAIGDELVSNESMHKPTAVKIDVEGYELDVIEGMKDCLKKSITKIFEEVHFLEMSKRGIKNGPAEIVRILNDSGFLVRWTDPSHLIAIRQ